MVFIIHIKLIFIMGYHLINGFFESSKLFFPLVILQYIILCIKFNLVTYQFHFHTYGDPQSQYFYENLMFMAVIFYMFLNISSLMTSDA